MVLKFLSIASATCLVASFSSITALNKFWLQLIAVFPTEPLTILFCLSSLVTSVSAAVHVGRLYGKYSELGFGACWKVGILPLVVLVIVGGIIGLLFGWSQILLIAIVWAIASMVILLYTIRAFVYFRDVLKEEEP